MAVNRTVIMTHIIIHINIRKGCGLHDVYYDALETKKVLS